ncbi:hypothetical protein Tco_0073468 [Tanacetum coccineum]
MMALYYRNSVKEDNEFARRIGVLLQEMEAAYDEMLDFIQELEAVSGVVAAVKTAEFLNDAFLKIQLMAELPICDELRRNVNSPDWEPQFILRCRREISEDLILAREINALCARVTAIVDERETFVEELDILGERSVPSKMGEFMKQVQGKDIPNLMKLQILGREFEPRAQEKGIFIEKLKGNLDF